VQVRLTRPETPSADVSQTFG